MHHETPIISISFVFTKPMKIPQPHNSFAKSIDNQIKTNSGKNLFSNQSDLFHFNSETLAAIAKAKELNNNNLLLLIDYATDKAITEFYRVNQYYTFDDQSKEELKSIYKELFEEIRLENNLVETIAKKHYQNLKKWIQKTNPFAENIYKQSHSEIEPVACSEYNADLQYKILRLDIENLRQPVLDIGCGSQAQLITEMRQQGIEATGIDRLSFDAPFLIKADWLTFDYGIQQWGTIISNLGFSNHFNHHNLRKDGNYIEYGKTYMKILNALKINGSFHYAPDLPFIEKFLDRSRFVVRKITIDNLQFTTTIVTRIR